MILIVDDNQENVFSLRTLLELNQYKVDVAYSGAEALKKILKNQYALIILDVQMPEMDGFEVAEAVSGYSKSKDIPILFLSAVNTHKKFITRGYTSGGIDYITKPFDPEILLLKISTFYRLSEQTRKLNLLEKELREEISLRKRAESVLEQKVESRTLDLLKANQELGESNKSLQQFAYIASHDLQEPLRKIQTFSNLILERHLNDLDKVKSYVEKISHSASRLRNLVRDLLNYSRSYSRDSFRKFFVKDVVREVLVDLEVDIPVNACDVHIDDSVEIEGDPLQVRQALQNLLSNAIKFSRPEVPPRISIRGERVLEKTVNSPVSPKGEYFRITISDNGIGFNNEYNQLIFELFQRLNDRTSFEGTGIGLAIVKRVVERHDGLINATGRENQGATFTIVLPVTQRKPAELTGENATASRTFR